MITNAARRLSFSPSLRLSSKISIRSARANVGSNMLFLRKSDKNLPLALTSPPQKRWLSRPSGQQSIFNPPRGNRGGGKIPPYVWGTTLAAAGIVGYTYYAFLDTVPVTNRRRWIATPPHFEEDLGHSEYKKMLAYFQKQGEVLPPNHRASITVKRVGSRLADAAIKFGKRHEMAHLSNSPYTYTVVRSDMANAFVIPGNHVFVMTGLFKYTKNEDEIAAVLGHEMAHNLARHAGEKISGSFVTNALARLSLLIDPSGALFYIFLPAAGLLRDLPHSRTQEMEADEIGVYLAAEACYDPRAAKRVFAAMKEGVEGSSDPPEFLSTHPSTERRIKNFDKYLPEAMTIFEGDPSSDERRCEKIRQRMKGARMQAAYEATLREQEVR